MHAKLNLLLIHIFMSPLMVEKEELDCPFTIIGGGAGGVHTAWRLLRQMKRIEHCASLKKRKVLLVLSERFSQASCSYPNQQIPQSLATYVKVWPGAWYPVGSTASPTMCAHEVANWAVSPLGEHEQVYMVGETYNPEQSGWTNAAYNSSIRVLNRHFGLSLESDP